MKYRQLGRTGIQVSELCLGSMLFGRRTEKAEALKIMDRALDAGINFIDTANAYVRGVSETIIGEGFAANGKRNRTILATKVHVNMDDSDPNARGNHRRHIIEQCEASLQRLNTDYIDIYYIHRPSPTTPIDETLRALDDLIRSGKVRYIGTSSFAAWQILESLWVSKEYGLNRFVVEQTPYHLLDRRVERELLPMAETYGIGVTLWSPLAGGFLTGKYDRNDPALGDTRLGDDPTSEWSQNHFKPEAFDVMDVVKEIAVEKDCLPVQVSLAWGLVHPAVHSTVLGARTLQQLEEQLPAVEITLTEEDLARLDAVTLTIPGRVIAPYYLVDGSRDFRPHQYRW